MKQGQRIVAFVLAFVLCASCLPVGMRKVSADSTETTTYNAYNDFSLTNGNPNGVWSYQERTKNGTTYTDLTLDTTNNRWLSNSTLSNIKAATSDLVTGESAICLQVHNQSHDAVLTFTAPETGTISIKMANGGVFAPHNSADGVRFSLTHNTTVVRSMTGLDNAYNTAGNRYFADTQELEVQAGDKIYFTIGRDVGVDSRSYLNPEITYTQLDEEELPSYNAYNDFSLTNGNPNGVWSYQERTKGGTTYTDLTLDTTNNRWLSSSTLSNIKAATSDLVTGEPAICLQVHNQSNDAVLTFTAPETGTISIKMANGGVFAPHNSADGVRFSLIHNTTVVRSMTGLDNAYNTAGNRYFTDTQELEVQAGDKIYFTIGRDVGVDSRSYLNPKITYTHLGEEENPLLRFPDNAEITGSDIQDSAFTISWPAALGGTAPYTYTAYISDTEITQIPTEGGTQVGAELNATFTGLRASTQYYVAVVVTDAAEPSGSVLLSVSTPIQTKDKTYTFNAYDDYSEKVQGSVWSYQTLRTGQTVTEDLEWSGSIWGSDTFGRITSTTSDLVTGKAVLKLIPGVDGASVVTFTAPFTGKVEVSMKNGGIFVPVNGSGDNWDGIKFTLRHNDTDLVVHDVINASNSHPSSVGAMYVGRLFTGVETIDVAEGDKLYFIVDKNTSNHNDDTYMNPQVHYTYVDPESAKLHFPKNSEITGTDATSSSVTINWPTAMSGEGGYEYTLFVSDAPITEIPADGGIDMGSQTSYALTGLPAYTDRYVAVTVTDGVDTVYMIKSEPISTIGNTYSFIAADIYVEKVQPISTPWRYYSVPSGDVKKATELAWDAKEGRFGTMQLGVVKYAESDLVTGNETLYVHPGPDADVAIAFVAPYTGKVKLSMENQGVFVPLNGAAQQHDGINFSVLVNGKAIYSKSAVNATNSHNDRCMGSSISLDVECGDVIYFIVNKNKATDSDVTYLNPRVDYTYVNKGEDTFAFLPGATVCASDATLNSFTLNWSAAFSPNAGNITYEVWLSTTKMSKQPSSEPIYSGTSLTTKCSGLSLGTNYYVYVKATDAKGQTAVLKTTEGICTLMPSYNAYEGYNTTNTPGIWNYTLRSYDGTTNQYVYSLLQKNESGTFGVVSLALINDAKTDYVTGQSAMYAHPGIGGNSAAVVFTAPYSGKIRILMANGGVFTPNNGKDQEFDGVRFIVLKNTTELLTIDNVSSKNNPTDSRVFTTPIEVTVKQGDRIYFVVEANASNAADSTYFNPFIEYLTVTGGNGKVRTDGFEEMEDTSEADAAASAKFLISNFRTNNATETDGTAKVSALQAVSSGIVTKWALPVGAALMILGTAIAWFLIPKGKKDQETEVAK